MWGELVKQFGEELAGLAPQDVERALSIAQKFQKDEVRVFVSLRLAARVLLRHGVAEDDPRVRRRAVAGA